MELEDKYCEHCNRFLGKAQVVVGAVAFKCTNSKCKQWTVIKNVPQKAQAYLTIEEEEAIIRLEAHKGIEAQGQVRS